MTENECIAQLERISAALDASPSLMAARALRDEREGWVRRREEARAEAYGRLSAERSLFVRVLDERALQMEIEEEESRVPGYLVRFCLNRGTRQS